MAGSDATRREMLGAGAGLAAGPGGASIRRGQTDKGDAAPKAPAAHDEAAWAKIAALYDPIRSPIQLENGNWGMMARPVAAAHQRHQAMVNHATSFYSRRDFAGDEARIRALTAVAMGVSPDEIVFTRGATEALQLLIGGYNRLKPGDEVLLVDLDYDSMITAMRWLRARRGVGVVEIALPSADITHQGLIDIYAAALKAHPKVRLMLLTQVSHRTGLVLPVREIVQMARRAGVDVIVDAAHAWGQTPDRPGDLGLDFAGYNAHKWIGAPLGIGVMYIRQGRTADIDPHMGSTEFPDPLDIRNRVHTGTASFATTLALEDALTFHASIPQAARSARLRYLRDRWAERVRAHPGVEVLTPAAPGLAFGITAFRLKGRNDAAANIALAKRLLDEFNIFTVHRTGLASGACVRVTPALFTHADEVDALAAAIERIATSA